ncbi:hypothetical protein [Methylorubrum extorquens]|uniref:hypothetical protein n=1 Tax=Methylorubrum extorquens TaxID=408 RepID=UPI002238DBB6|nr:hypothetical protein [Methylorubrum extorquens]UYW34465.1 hypothetical protein OKB92_10405 [Methylorubrum extorquens]
MAMPEYTVLLGSQADKDLARETLRVTKEVRILLGQHVLYKRLTRNKEFGESCDASVAKEGVAIVVGAVLRTIVTSAAAIFDKDGRTSNIPKLAKQATSTDRVEFLRKLHSANGGFSGFQDSYDRLVNYRRRARSGKLQEAIARLEHVRSTTVAHFDANPRDAPGGKRAIGRDVDYVVAAGMVIAGEANKFILAREVDYPALRKLLRSDAEGFCSTLMAGFAASLPRAKA